MIHYRGQWGSFVTTFSASNVQSNLAVNNTRHMSCITIPLMYPMKRPGEVMSIICPYILCVTIGKWLGCSMNRVLCTYDIGYYSNIHLLEF